MLKIFDIFEGDPAEAEAGIAFIELASDGDPTAKSRLVYPGSPPELPPITYFTNPDRRLGFDNDSLINKPAVTMVQTLDDQVKLSFDSTIADRNIIERWTVDGGKLASSIAFYRELRGYFENPPDEDVDGYIEWSPANQSTKTFNVQLVKLQVGSDPMLDDVTEFRPIGGNGTNAGPDGGLGVEFDAAGWVDAEMILALRIVSEV